MSWLGPASSGAHPRTKGAVLHRRAPAPITADHEGSPGGSCSLASHRETLRRGRKKRRSTERAWCGSQRSYLQVPRPGTAGRDAPRIKKALRAGRPAGHAAECGTGATPPKAGTAHGERGGQEPLRPLRRGREAPRLSCRIRLAACLCSPGSGCTTRTGRAAALARGCAALRACRPLGNLDGQEALPYCAINCEIHAACLPMNTSRVSCPASIMSSACSQTAVVPGSAIAAGTASIKVKAASEARMARPFFTR